MIKELIYLIKLLFTKVSNSLEIVRLKHFPFKNYVAMMWCGKLITRESEIPYVVKNHELIHLKQAQAKGSWFKYYLSYIWEYIKHLPFPDIAYFTNPYEMEAYANERNYIQNYDPKNIERYKIKHVKKKYKSYSDVRDWFNYIRTL